ncbi:Acyltransferase family [Fusicatenibacter sp. 2789STDY5834925]|nr:Acyltransferase family [Fusicatenibacter sp. 2789STDY5834925]
MLQLSGFEEQSIVINGVTGQIAALLVATLILYYFFAFYKRMFVNIGLILIMFIYSHILHNYGNLSQWIPYEQWYCIGILRAIAGMMVGGGTYYIVVKKMEKLKRIPIYSMCLICVISCGFLVLLRDKIAFSDLLLFIPIFSVMISSAYLIHLFERNIIIQRIMTFFGKMSYYIFLVHYPICKLLQYFMSGKNYFIMSGIYLLFVFFCAYMLMILNITISRIIMSKRFSKICK